MHKVELMEKYIAVFVNAQGARKESKRYSSLVSLMDAMRSNWVAVYNLLKAGYTVTYEIVNEEA